MLLINLKNSPTSTSTTNAVTAHDSDHKLPAAPVMLDVEAVEKTPNHFFDFWELNEK